MEKKCGICLGDTTEPEHNNTFDHAFNFSLFQWQNYRKPLVKDRHGIAITVEPLISETLMGKFHFIEKKGTYVLSITPHEFLLLQQVVTFRCTASNTMKVKSVQLTSATILYPHQCYCLEDPAGVMTNDLLPQLSPGTTYVVLVKFQLAQLIIANFKIPISFSFQTVDAEPNTFTIARSIVISIEDKQAAIGPVERSPFTKLDWGKGMTIVPATSAKHKVFTNYSIPEQYWKCIVSQLREPHLIGNGFITGNYNSVLAEINRKLYPGLLTLQNYRDYFHILLWLEEICTRLGLARYNMENVTLEVKGANMLNLVVPGLAEKRPSVIVGDHVEMRVHNDHTGYEGIIKFVGDTYVDISFVDTQLIKTLKSLPTMEMDVRFVLGRLIFIRMHKAVDLIIKHNLAQYLFPPLSCARRIPPKVYSIHQSDYFNPDIKRNHEQSQAVVNILNNTSRSSPYIVFGPPGTGKTVTIVEAMLQLKRLTNKRMLVCAPANAACNMLTAKLMPHCTGKELVRVCSQSMDKQLLSDELLPYTNFAKGEDEMVSLSADKLLEYRIVVTTLVHAGKYSETKYVPDVIFVDEAAQASEPEALIPLGLLKGGATQLVLAGDPKQLGPIVGSNKAKELGLGKSLLERLMDLELYKPDGTTGHHNANFITMLILNFRSHAAILEIPNRMFYMGRLQAVSVTAHNDPIANVHVYSHIKELNLKKKKKTTESVPAGTPLEFCSVVAKERREGRSPSFFNNQEINLVEKYVTALCGLRLDDRQTVIPSQIGVVTPYIRQVYKIKSALEDKFPGIEVGTTEVFQGREKRIIIISTVRGQQDLLKYDRQYDLGFVSNEKRFNVALTRAKSKLIVIGNPLVLGTDKKWLTFINKCEETGAFCGAPYMLRTDDLKQKVKNKMQSVHLQDSQYRNGN